MTILFLIFLFLIWWSVQGYFLFLYISGRGKTKFHYPQNEKQPELNRKFSIIVPTFNEEQVILEKVDNLKKFTDKNFEVIFIDASTDKTPQLIEHEIKGLDFMRLVRTEKPGRSNQINSVLDTIETEFIVMTDADTILGNDMLGKLEKEFNDPRIGLVAGYVVPYTDYKLDILFWQSQNIMRVAESFYGHCPVASGGLYAFRKKLLEGKIPIDVWADDIYIPFLVNLKGFNSVYSSNIPVKEIRGPHSFNEFLTSKVRKAKDNMRELFRFLPKVFLMKPDWLVVYLTRFIQVVFSPILICLLVLMLIFCPYLLKVFSYAMVLSLIPAYFHKKFLRKISSVKEKFKFWDLLKIFALTNLILFLAIISFFFKNKFHYTRIEKK